MDTVFFPLDEELALLPGSLAPRQQEHLAHLACFMPFDKAAQMIEEIFSADGAMISLVHTQWAETRTVAIGELEEQQRTTTSKPESHVGHLSYFSRLADASTFLDLAKVEMRRRKVKEAKQVCAVMDGADWLQTFTDRHRPDAVRILDFPHAAEHVTQLLEALTQTGMRFPPQMLYRCLHILKYRGPRSLLRLADHLGSNLVQHKGAQEHLDASRVNERR